MMAQCYIAIGLGVAALALASYPHLHSFWQQHSRRARWHRRLGMAKLLVQLDERHREKPRSCAADSTLPLVPYRWNARRLFTHNHQSAMTTTTKKET